MSETYAARRSLLWSGAMLGIGVIGTLDGVILHELLQWHKFYVRTTEFWRTFIDGLFHLVTAAFLFAGAYRLWVTRHLLHRAGRERVPWAGILFGMGGFNLYDGIVQHKIFQLHPVREGVEVRPSCRTTSCSTPSPCCCCSAAGLCFSRHAPGRTDAEWASRRR
ncbi:MAG TPA: DUF2243 domain-containing protein [Chloroflexota bacterium]|nr:DUF2243 domain-containing protein [Chloroflexota bacterium]